MTDFENRLEARLSQDDEAFLADLENGQGFFTQLGATFKGPMGWLSVLVLCAALVMVGLAVWFGYEAFQATSAKVTTLWATGAVAAILGNALLRIFLMSRMSQVALLKELKKIQLQLAKLESRVG